MRSYTTKLYALTLCCIASLSAASAAPPAKTTEAKPAARKSETVKKSAPAITVTPARTSQQGTASSSILPASTLPQLAKNGQIQTFFSGCEATLEKAEFTREAMPNLFGPVLPDPGTQYLVCTLKVKNIGTAPVTWQFDRFNPNLQTNTPGAQIIRGNNLVAGSNAKFETQPIQSGEEKTIRFHFQVPQNVTPTQLTFGANPNQPEYVFPLIIAPAP